MCSVSPASLRGSEQSVGPQLNTSPFEQAGRQLFLAGIALGEAGLQKKGELGSLKVSLDCAKSGAGRSLQRPLRTYII